MLFRPLTPSPCLPAPPSGVSPSPTSLLDRYGSPTGTAGRRRLFVDSTDAQPTLVFTLIPMQMSVMGQGTATLQPLSAQALTGSLSSQSPAAAVVTTTTTTTTTATAAVAKTPTKPPSTPLRKGSLSLFFRKVRLRPPVAVATNVVRLTQVGKLSLLLWE